MICMFSQVFYKLLLIKEFQKGKAYTWYYNSETGYFVTFIDDADDFIYMITPEQINQANGDNNGTPPKEPSPKRKAQKEVWKDLIEQVVQEIVG